MDRDEVLLDGPHSPSSQSQYPEFDQTLCFPWTGNKHLNNGQSSPPTIFPGSNSESAYHEGHSLSSTGERPDIQPVAQLLPYLRASSLSFMGNTIPTRPARIMGPGAGTDFLETLGQSSGDDNEISEADSDYEGLQSDLASFRDSVLKFRAEQRENSTVDEVQASNRGRMKRENAHRWARRGGRGSRGRGILRGPRKAAEPTGDIKLRMSNANLAFIEEKYDDALREVLDVIQINAETHEAWTLLGSIFKELGESGKALISLVFACHLRPKDVDQWLRCAKFALEETGDERPRFLSTAKMCYSSAIRANPKETFEARCGKAAVLRELGNPTSAISEYKTLLKTHPHNTSILRLIAEAYIDQDNVEAAIGLYRTSIEFYKSREIAATQEFGWSDINIYVELYGYLGRYSEGIRELKSLSRWLLGRQNETFWDDVTDDDREWDLDNYRRMKVSSFMASRYGLEQYGMGLPLELRVKLGLYRVRIGFHEEAMGHLGWLDPENMSGEDKIIDYNDLFRESADCLQEFGFPRDALVFYRAIHVFGRDVDAELQLRMGKCHLALKDNAKAEEFFQMAIQLDESNVEARVQLAKLYEDQNEGEQAFLYVSEIMSLRRLENWRRREQREEAESQVKPDTFIPQKREPKSYYRPRRLVDPTELQRQEDLRAERLQERYAILRLQERGMRAGEENASLAWMEAAKELTEDFRAFKTFYPWDKYVHFLGYTGSTRGQLLTGATPLDDDVAAMADRLSNRLSARADDKGAISLDIPENYRGISFATWLDIFLEYALCLVRYGRRHEAYDVCDAARDAIVYYHSVEDMFLIHVCYCACAILANDEKTCLAVSRYFMKEYQFTTDSYRMFAALGRLCQSPVSWYSSGPTQKYMLRQIRAMDYALASAERPQTFYSEKASHSEVDKAGKVIINDDLDVALLMVYGHILYSGTSYVYALNYFFRAHALDPGNPMINLSIGLGYIHYGLKRQADNRQFHIVQGLSFLFKYYDSRRESVNVEERQEAHYNIARAYHLLGLTHLALPFYIKVLSEVQTSAMTREDLVLDAAYNSQSLFAMSGNLSMAKHIAETWLVI